MSRLSHSFPSASRVARGLRGLTCRSSGLGALGALLATLTLALPACDDTEPFVRAPAGAAGSTACEVGAPLPDGTCITAGVPADQCGEGFLADGKQGCEPILPQGDCPEGTMPMIGHTDCQVVGVPPDQCGDGFVSDGRGGCDPVLPTEDCPDGTMPMLGHTDCQPVGVQVGMGLACADGFQDDGHGGCDAILPADECPAGQMAVPGETQCHLPQSCGTGTYGDIPIDATTQYVDASYSAGDSDGSSSKPWPTLTLGVSHAATGAVVAVAEGTYPENLVLAQGVRVWGVCPSKVQVTGGAAEMATVRVNALPRGQTVEIHGMGITGAASGVEVFGATAVTLTGAWVHDTGGEFQGIHVRNEGADASLTVQDTLVEGAHHLGVLVEGAQATLDASVVRGTLAKVSDSTHGDGIDVVDNAGKGGTLTLSHSVLAHNQRVGLLVNGSDATVQRTVVHDTQAQLSDMTGGVGAVVEDDNGQRGTLTMSDSLLGQNRFASLICLGSALTVRNTVVRQTQPQLSDTTFGVGILVQDDQSQRGALTLDSSLVEQSHYAGVLGFGSDLTVQNTVVRDTQPQASDMTLGPGVQVTNDPGQRGHLTLTHSSLTDNHNAGLVIAGSDATVQGSVIRDTQPQLLDNTDGIGIKLFVIDDERSTMALSSSLIERNRHAGVYMLASDATIDTTTIRTTQCQLSTELGGEGIAVDTMGEGRSSLTLRGSLVDHNENDGVIVQGSEATVENSLIRATQPQRLDRSVGHGIDVINKGDLRGHLALSTSVLDHNTEVSLYVDGADATMTNTVIRTTNPRPSDGNTEIGMGIFLKSETGQRATLEVASSMLDQNHESGMTIVGADATVQTTLLRDTPSLPSSPSMYPGTGIFVAGSEDQTGHLSLISCHLERKQTYALYSNGGADISVHSTLVHDTQPNPSDDVAGIGVFVSSGLTGPVTLDMSSSLLDGNHLAGLVVANGSSATVRQSVIRNTQPQASDQTAGFGIQIASGPDGDPRGGLILSGSLLDANTYLGLNVLGSDATIENTVIRNTRPQPSNMLGGDGIVVQSLTPTSTVRGALTLTSSLLEQNRDSGLAMLASDGTIRSTIVRNTSAQIDGTFGDGVGAVNSHLSLEDVILLQSARASVSNFGSVVTLQRVEALCAPILFDQETSFTEQGTGVTTTFGEATYTPEDTACFTCDGSTLTCKSVSKHLSPPRPVPPLEPSQPPQP